MYKASWKLYTTAQNVKMSYIPFNVTQMSCCFTCDVLLQLKYIDNIPSKWHWVSYPESFLKFSQINESASLQVSDIKWCWEMSVQAACLI